MNAAERAQMFHCPHLRCVISRAICGARHERFRRSLKGRPDGGTPLGYTACACKRCEIGAAHASGRLVPDVALASVVPVRTVRRAPVRRCDGCGEPLPPVPPGQHLKRASKVCSPACEDVLRDVRRRAEELSLPEWA